MVAASSRAKASEISLLPTTLRAAWRFGRSVKAKSCRCFLKNIAQESYGDRVMSTDNERWSPHTKPINCVGLTLVLLIVARVCLGQADVNEITVDTTITGGNYDAVAVLGSAKLTVTGGEINWLYLFDNASAVLSAALSADAAVATESVWTGHRLILIVTAMAAARGRASLISVPSGRFALRVESSAFAVSEAASTRAVKSSLGLTGRLASRASIC